MTTALPASVAFTDPSVTEGAFKTAIAAQRTFLADLLGADGLAATARTALGLGSIATQAASSVTITGGTINSAIIGGSTPAAGTFTALVSTSGTLNGTLGGSTPAAAAVTTLTATGKTTGSATTLSNGSDIVSNGTFASDTVWTKGANWSIAAGVATAATASSFLYQGLALTAGKIYACEFTVTAYTSGSVGFWENAGGVFGPTAAATGTYRAVWAGGATPSNVGFNAAAFVGSIDNVSIKEISLNLPALYVAEVANIGGTLYNPGHGTTASAANTYVDSTSGQVLRSTSSMKYKKDWEQINPAVADKVLSIEAGWYRSNTELCVSDNPDWSWYGCKAEEVAKIDPRFVNWGFDATDYEKIERVEEVEVPDMETVSVPYRRIEVVAGKPVLKIGAESVTRQKVLSMPLFDEGGKRVMVEKITIDADGEKHVEQVPAVHDVPQTKPGTRVTYERRLKEGAQISPQGVTYDRLIVPLLGPIGAMWQDYKERKGL